MKKIIIVVLVFPFVCIGQERGVRFAKGLAWKQVKDQARLENKYIFVDCFATWCGPCKKMDKEIYPLDTIGEMINKRFIAVKVQLDTSKSDDEYVKGWYAQANAMKQEFQVRQFPTYLFFDPGGNLVHRSVGYQTTTNFMHTIFDALDSEKQYYTLVEKYRHHALKYISMPSLASEAREFSQDILADSIARDYMYHFLLDLSADELYKKNNIEFMRSFFGLVRSKDSVFELFYHHGNRINSAMNDNGYSERLVDYVITKEEVVPTMNESANKNIEPDWKAISRGIKLEYGKQYAQRNIATAKTRWYHQRKEFSKYATFLVRQVRKYGVGINHGFWYYINLNNDAWDIFLYSNKKRELQAAITWVNLASRLDSVPNANLMDTKANLLYKLNRNDEAVALERQAQQLEPQAENIRITLDRMKKGLPTWEEDNN